MSLDRDPGRRSRPLAPAPAVSHHAAAEPAQPSDDHRRVGTRAADGFERRAFTVGECVRMQDLGIIGPEERYELIDGDLIIMQAKHSDHERIKLALNRLLSRHLPDHLQLGIETSLFLAGKTFVDPDLSVFPFMDTEAVRGPDVLLAIEVAVSTLGFDLGLKSRTYARYGIRELWVIDALRRVTHVHRVPVDGAWTEVATLGAEVPLTHPTAPGFSLVLDDV